MSPFPQTKRGRITTVRNTAPLAARTFFGDAAFAVEDDAGGHLLCGKAGVVPHDGDNGDIDVGEDIRRHRNDAVGAEDQDQERKDSESIGPPER